MAAANNIGGGTHVLIIPFPSQGHMLPLLDLTHQLALRCGGDGLRSLTITILVTPKNLAILDPLLSKHYHPSSVVIKTLVLPFPTHPSIPIGVENVKDLPPSYFGPMMRTMGELYNPILHWFRSHPSSPPSAIISDFFLGWTNHLACELDIPRIVFCPSGALTLAISACQWRDLHEMEDPNDPNAIVSFPQVPNCPSYPWWQISSPLYHAYKEGTKMGDPGLEFMRDGMLANSASWGMIFNSFHELEGIYLDHLRKELGHQRVWSVGPLLIPSSLSSGASNTTNRGGSSSVMAHDVLSWLDACDDDRSVVYICFGSQAVLSNKQMEALATGLEQSGVRFIWCVKEATIGHSLGDYGMVPQWFEDRVKGRGLLIKGWAPQVLILRHRAVGSFLTHCGWNSVMEAVVAGVPMLTWPMGADQYINVTLLVDQMKVAVRVCEGEKKIPNAAELARVLAESVTTSSSSNSTSKKAMELSKAAMDAIEDGGTSFKDLDALVHSLLGLN